MVRRPVRRGIPGRPAGRAVVRIQDYFTFLEMGQSLDGTPFLEDYLNPDYGVMSMRLNIPAMWQEILMPEDDILVRQEEYGRNGLPPAIINRFNRMGLICDTRRYARRSHAGGSLLFDGRRRYILRRHHIPITIATYRQLILPRLTTNWRGFYNVANELHVYQQIDALLPTENFGSNDWEEPWEIDFLNNLPPGIRGFFR